MPITPITPAMNCRNTVAEGSLALDGSLGQLRSESVIRCDEYAVAGRPDIPVMSMKTLPPSSAGAFTQSLRTFVTCAIPSFLSNGNSREPWDASC